MNYGKIDKKKFMTLENTVALLVDAVNQHYDVDRVLSDFGITVVGRVSYVGDIPNFYDNNYTGNYGDAYLVSVNSNGLPPYDVWIWTRYVGAETEDPPIGQWLNLGPLVIAGPPGETIKGDKGDPGDSTRWYISTYLPISGNYTDGDMLLLKGGDCYCYDSTQSVNYGWGYPIVNISGPIGTPGKDGITPRITPDGYWAIGTTITPYRAIGLNGKDGTPAPPITIAGTLESISLLPEPGTADRLKGYLITISGTTYLYYINDSFMWTRIPYTGSGTIVTTDGVTQATWDTNTKRNISNTANTIYATTEDGDQTQLPYGTVGSGVAVYTDSGTLQTYVSPEESADLTNKGYVDASTNARVSRVTEISAYDRAYIAQKSGNDAVLAISDQPSYSTLVKRNTNGCIESMPPTEDNELATKAYVDALGGGTSMVTTTRTSSSGGTAAIISISDLSSTPKPGTPFWLTWYWPSDGISSLPSYAFKVGSTSIAGGVPNVSANAEYGAVLGHITPDDQFCINKTDGTSVTGNTISCGYTAASQIYPNTLTLTYITE